MYVPWEVRQKRLETIYTDEVASQLQWRRSYKTFPWWEKIPDFVHKPGIDLTSPYRRQRRVTGLTFRDTVRLRSPESTRRKRISLLPVSRQLQRL